MSVTWTGIGQFGLMVRAAKRLISTFFYRSSRKEEMRPNQIGSHVHVEAILQIGAINLNKYHIMRHLSKVLDEAQRSENKRYMGKDRSSITGLLRNTLLLRREHLSLDGQYALKRLH
jgi:hypothetical protein